MIRYLLRRLGQSLILLWLVSMIGFGILHLAPGGPLAQFANIPGMSSADLARIAHQMGLDAPLPLQYWRWLVQMLAGDWGRSYRDQQPVLGIIASHLGATLELMVSSTLIAVLGGTWIGILGAIRRYSAFDYLATIGAMIALSIPTFWFGLVTIYVFSVELGWLPSGNLYTIGNGSLLDYLHHLIAPAMVLALVTIAIWSRYMRSSMLEVINQDYIRTARAKGLPERVILIHHAVRNALLPMITIAGLQLPTLLSGALVT
ncbi:MAG: ABC transporter permease, partial [Acetobacteraceae bacterium]